MPYYGTTLDKFAGLARAKRDALSTNPVGFVVASIMAGAYVGIGIILIFSLGDQLKLGTRRLVMGASFGIALTLVVFAGSELFTGHTMYMTQGLLSGRTSVLDLFKVWIVGWYGNLLGAFLLGWLFVVGGSDILGKPDGLLYATVAKKMSGSPESLIARAALCNWLVCLALWTAARTENDTAKCVLIFWCLFAFIASGFEHSVANMTLFSIALLSPHAETISLWGAFYNLALVSFGNALSGVLFMGVGYWLVAGGNAVSGRKTAKGQPAQLD